MKKSRSAHAPCLLSIPEVAWLLSVDNSWVCRAIRVGLLPVVRRGRHLLIPAHALAHLIDSDDQYTNPYQMRSSGRGDAR